MKLPKDASSGIADIDNPEISVSTRRTSASVMATSKDAKKEDMAASSYLRWGCFVCASPVSPLARGDYPATHPEVPLPACEAQIRR
jgi:hypothetical protein